MLAFASSAGSSCRRCQAPKAVTNDDFAIRVFANGGRDAGTHRQTLPLWLGEDGDDALRGVNLDSITRPDVVETVLDPDDGR